MKTYTNMGGLANRKTRHVRRLLSGDREIPEDNRRDLVEERYGTVKSL